MPAKVAAKAPSLDNVPPPPMGESAEEALSASVTVPIIMGKERSLGLSLNTDNVITSVAVGSAAEKAGIRMGDVVLGWQGNPLEGKRLQDLLRPAPVHILSVARGSALLSARGVGGAPSSQRDDAKPRAVPSAHMVAPAAPPSVSPPTRSPPARDSPPVSSRKHAGSSRANVRAHETYALETRADMDLDMAERRGLGGQARRPAVAIWEGSSDGEEDATWFGDQHYGLDERETERGAEE